MIAINWSALLQVAIVTFGATMLVVAVVSLAATLLDRGHIAATAGEVESPYRSRHAWIAALLFIVAFGIVGFGMYLLIPWWH